jgi:hypothetical protein
MSVSPSVQAPGKRHKPGNEIERRRNRRIDMRTVKMLLLAAALVALVTPAAFARQAAPHAAPATIHQRKKNQQVRIASGVKNGQLTARETANLEAKQASLNREEHRMRAANGGKLTAADRARLRRRQNRLSRQVYNKKHNARVQ